MVVVGWLGCYPVRLYWPPGPVMSFYARADFRPQPSSMIRCLVDVFSRPLLAGECVEVAGVVGYGVKIKGLDAGSDQSFALSFVGPKGLVPSVGGGSWDMGRVIAWVARSIGTSSQCSEIFTALDQGTPAFPELTALRVEGVSDYFSMRWPSGVEVSALAAPASAEWSAMVLAARLAEPQARTFPVRL